MSCKLFVPERLRNIQSCGAAGRHPGRQKNRHGGEEKNGCQVARADAKGNERDEVDLGDARRDRCQSGDQQRVAQRRHGPGDGDGFPLWTADGEHWLPAAARPLAERLSTMPAVERAPRAAAALLDHGVLAPEDLPLTIVPDAPKALDGWRFA